MEGKKSYGFGFFNPDDRLKQIIGDIASERDLKSLRCTFLLLLEHPLVKPRLLERYGEQAYKEMVDKYNVTTKTEAEREKKSAEKNKKAKIEAFKVLGFSENDAEKLSELSSEDLKTLAYIKQNTPQNRINREEKLEYVKMTEEKTILESSIRGFETSLAKHPEQKQIIEAEIQKRKDQIAQLDQKMKTFLEVK